MYSSTKLHLGKESLCLLNSWETERKKKILPVAQKKNITNVFMVLSGLKKWLHQFSWCFTWNRSGREAAFAGPSLCKEHRDAGCFPSTVHGSPSEQEPHPRLKGHSPPTVRAYLPITAYHHHACRKQNREQIIFAHFNLPAQTIHRSRGNWVPLCAKPSVMCYVYMISFHFSTINAIIISIFRCGMEACRASVICPNPHNQYMVTPGFKPWSAWLHRSCSLPSCCTVPTQKKADSNYLMIFFKFKHNQFNNITLVSGVRIKLF